MPTPVSVARQCLTEEAARALDDAVSVSRRRSHTQTTSLHAVSALLSLSPSSPLRSACLRSTTAASPRLHLRALELSVNVSLDRLPTTRSPDAAASSVPPLVANSLMAAIKRSQANQRRHPDTWQLYQQLSGLGGAQSAIVKVEMKHFILSILDDPIVSRVLGEAGFRSSDLKVSVFHPPPTVAKLPAFPPLLFNFPFSFDSFDDNCRKIREIMGKQRGSKRNPLLIGGFANEALLSFTDRVRNGELMEGVRVVLLEREGLEGNLEELRGVLGNCSKGGVLVSVGDFIGLVEGVVLELSEMMMKEGFGGKLWVIGAVGSYDIYMKILGKFPNMEKDWDLQVLPITSSPSNGGLSSKPSCIGSFVPLGGFFPSPSEFSSQLSHTNQSSRCGVCNEKYENEASAAVKGDSEVCSSSDYSAKDDRTILNAKLTLLQNKWNDICRHLHPTKPSSPDIPKTVSQFVGNPHFATNSHQSSSNKSSLDRNLYPYLIASSPMDIQRAVVPKPLLSYPTISELSNAMSLTENHLESPCSVTSVTTDLGLGTIFAQKEPENYKVQDHKSRLPCCSMAVSTKPDGNGKSGSNCVISEQLDVRDFKSIYRLFSEKIGRQNEAISTICQAISRCKAGFGRPRGSSRRGDIWLNFIGHDKVGKRRVALALADVIFGNKGTMISVDLGSENEVRCSNSIFRGRSENKNDGKSWGKTGVDCIIDELSKKPHSVVFLENVDRADYLAQDSLLQAIRTGRLANSHRKEISISNAIFVTSSDASKKSDENLYKKDTVRFSEEKILDAKSSQMQILVRCVDEYRKNTNATNVFIVGRKESLHSNKRKLIDMNESTLDEPKRAHKGSNFMLDLNVPLEEGKDTEYEIAESDRDLENSKAWLEELSDQVDENIIFQPFDFDALSNELLRFIDRRLRMTLGPDVVLEIDDDVAVQVMAAVWLSEKRVVENWVEHVLRRTFEEAKERCKNLNGRTVMKLVACEGVRGEEQFSGVCLPSRINIINR